MTTASRANHPLRARFCWPLPTSPRSGLADIPAEKLRAVGYGETFPKLPNRDAYGNALLGNQMQNRRVVIRLEKIEQAEGETSPLGSAFVPPPDLE